jgi:mono/diheme cytochrome c family protein
MKTHLRLQRRGALAACLLVAGTLALGGCTLAGEPVPAGPIQSGSAEDLPAPEFTPAPTVELPPDIGYPLEAPDAARGAALFAARCAACHGLDGSGQGGEMAPTLIEMGVEMPDFTDTALVHQRTPAELFDAITNGNLDAFMPPWGSEFTEAERWNLAFYVYTLTTSQETLEVGEALYQVQCAACHGESGAGDGPEAAGAVPDLTDAIIAVERSPQALFETVSAGAGEAMPAFEETLSEDERWAVVDYVRTFTYQPLPPPHEVMEVPATQTGTVSGTVTNVTTGEPLGEGQTVLLHGLIVTEASIEEIISLETTTDADGNYTFEDVPFDAQGLVYVADLAYAGIEFNNFAFVTPGETTAVELPLEVYDTTQDPSVLNIDTMHIVVSPQNVDTLLIAQIYIFSNNSDYVYISEETITETRHATVKMPVPDDAIGLAFEDGELGGRFVQTEDGVLDTAAVLPGQQSHNVVMTYLLPYDGEYTLTIPLEYGASSISVLSEDVGLRVRADGLTATDTGDPQLDQFQILGGEDFSSGEELVINIKGTPGAAPPADNVGLIVAAGVAVLALVGAGGWWLRSRGKPRDQAASQPGPGPAAGQASQRELMQAIASLDDAYEAGQIGKADYEVQRARLKADLVALVESEGGGA